MMRRSEKNMKGRREEDRISELSDDILTSIICHLTLKEAIATSVLSRRWRHLSAYVTHLDFPPFKPKINIQNRQETLTKLRQYTKWIDRVVGSHKGTRVKEFKVEADYATGADIEPWLELALANQAAEIIVLHLHMMRHCLLDNVDVDVNGPRRRHRYSLHLHSFINGRSTTPRVLRELSLSGIDVDESDLDLLLSSFPLLESLTITDLFSKGLRKVSVGTPAPALKAMAISGALHIESVEIEDMINLVSLRLLHLGSPFFVRINNAPKLVELSTVDDFRCSLPQFFSGVSPSVRAQLLTLRILKNSPLMRYLDEIPEFISVKRLELEYTAAEANGDFSLWRFFRVIQACPVIEELEIKMRWYHENKFKADGDDEERDIPVRKHTLKEVCRDLKTMKLSGFFGTTTELGLAFSIMWHAKSLQEIVVEACRVNEEARGIATRRAWHHLLPKIPPYAILRVI